MFISDYRSHTRFNPDKMQKVNLFESHRMFADLYCLMPGQEQRVHSHPDNDKVYFVLEGTATGIVGDQQQAMRPGQSCAAPAGVPHGVANRSEHNVVVLVFMAPKP